MPFDEDKARRAIRFFERRLRLPSGEPFVPITWERKIIWDLFGTVRADGKRQYREAYITVAKKNGKTGFAAGLALCALSVDDEPAAECYVGASTRDQAGKLHREAGAFVRKDHILSEMFEVIDSTKVIYNKEDKLSFFKALSSDAANHDGINPHVAIYDELHRQQNRDLWDVFKYGMAMRSQPLLIAITTAGIQDESPLCAEIHEYALRVADGTFHDPAFYSAIYAVDKDADWRDEGTPGKWSEAKMTWLAPPTGWYAANPSLEGNPGGFMPVETMRREAREAGDSPVREAGYRRFRCNQWTEQSEIWITDEAWDRCGEPFNPSELLGKQCFGALDLSSTIDLTALCLEFPLEDATYLLWKFFLPKENITERARRDRVPYDVWAKQGLLTLTEGAVVDYAVVRQAVNDAAALYGLQQVAHDPWNATQLATELIGDGFDMVQIRQSFASLSAPAKDFEGRILARRIRHGGNPIARWMNRCCTVKQDPAGNIKPIKPDRKSSSKRIDGILAAIMGLDCIARFENRQPYQDYGVMVL